MDDASAAKWFTTINFYEKSYEKKNIELNERTTYIRFRSARTENRKVFNDFDAFGMKKSFYMPTSRIISRQRGLNRPA